MARQVIVAFEGATSTFDISKVDRSKLYGRRMRVPLDEHGEKCARASLTEDGSVMVKSGMTAQGWFDEEGTWFPNKELVGINPDGDLATPEPSTLGEEQELIGPVDPSEVLDLRLQSVYWLNPEDLDPALEDYLQAGDVFRFKFNYRADFRSETAFLIANPEGECFALIGRMTEPLWRDAEEMLPTFTESDEEEVDDELDFEMF